MLYSLGKWTLILFLFCGIQSNFVFAEGLRSVEKALMKAILRKETGKALQIIQNRVVEDKKGRLENFDFVESASMEFPLSLSIQMRETKVVRALLDAGADPNGPSFPKYLPLGLAIAQDDEALFKLLLENPWIDLKAKDSEGHSLLHFTILQEKWQWIPILLRKGVSPSLRDKDENLPILYLLQKMKTAFINSESLNTQLDEAWMALMDTSPLTDIDSKGNSIVHAAIILDNLKLLKKVHQFYLKKKLTNQIDMVNFNDFCASTVNKDKNTALHLAALGENADLVVYLLNEAQVSPNSQFNDDGNSPLSIVLQGTLSPAKYKMGLHLLLHGAEEDIINGSGMCTRNILDSVEAWKLALEVKTVPLESSEIRKLIQKIKRRKWQRDVDGFFTIEVKKILLEALYPKLQMALYREFFFSESSLSEKNLYDVECVTCEAPAKMNDLYCGPAQCKCFLCEHCSQKFIKCALEDVRAKEGRCPKCKFRVHPEYFVKNGVSQEQVNRYFKLFQARVDKSRVPCPTPNCEGGVSTEELEKSHLFSCEFCEFSGCPRCGKWHKKPECGAMDADEKDEALDILVKAGKIKKCSNCHVFVERSEGCPSMVCFNCGKRWTW